MVSEHVLWFPSGIGALLLGGSWSFIMSAPSGDSWWSWVRGPVVVALRVGPVWLGVLFIYGDLALLYHRASHQRLIMDIDH